MGIPIVDVMVAECEGVRRNMEIGAGCLVWKGVVYQNHAVMRARALRQQSAADLEVWLKRLLRHGDARLGGDLTCELQQQIITFVVHWTPA